MIEKTITIENKFGLHARPAAIFVQKASQYGSDVKLIKDGLEVNGKSIMGVLMLAAERGSKVTIRIQGEDEEDAAKELIAFLKGRIDEEDGVTIVSHKKP